MVSEAQRWDGGGMTNSANDLLLTKAELAALLKVPLTTLPKVIYQRGFPAGVSLTGTAHGSKRWFKSDVLAWLASKKR